MLRESAIALRWWFDQPRVAVVPKAASTSRQAENLEVWDFELSDAERARDAALPTDRREFDSRLGTDWNA